MERHFRRLFDSGLQERLTQLTEKSQLFHKSLQYKLQFCQSFVIVARYTYMKDCHAQIHIAVAVYTVYQFNSFTDKPLLTTI